VRHGESRAVELTGEIDRDAAVPFIGIDLLHASCGTGDSGVVHQAIESTEVLQGFGKQCSYLRSIGDVAPRPRQSRIAAAQC
jgi:hypothetical protein